MNFSKVYWVCVFCFGFFSSGVLVIVNKILQALWIFLWIFVNFLNSATPRLVSARFRYILFYSILTRRHKEANPSFQTLNLMYHKYQVKVESQKTEKQNLTRLKEDKDITQIANCSFAQNSILNVRMEIKRQRRFTVKQRKPCFISFGIFSKPSAFPCFIIASYSLFYRASAYSQPHHSSPPFNYRSAIHRIRVIEGRPVNQRRGLPRRWPQTTQEDEFNTRGD